MYMGYESHGKSQLQTKLINAEVELGHRTWRKQSIYGAPVRCTFGHGSESPLSRIIFILQHRECSRCADLTLVAVPRC